MTFSCHLEHASWVEPAGPLLHLSGWLLPPPGSAFQAIRLRRGGSVVDGYYGLRRPDVAAAHPAHPGAGLSGFTFLCAAGTEDFPLTLEAQDATGAWHDVLSVPRTAVTRRPGPAPVAAERETGLEPAPAEDARPVLFISHDFAAAGAQLFLVRLLRWLRDYTSLTAEVLIAVPRGSAAHASEAEQGVLRAFHEAGPVHFLSDLTQAPENLARIRAGRYRLVYAHTGTLGWLLPSLRPFACPVISHVHELGFWLKYRTGLDLLARQAAQTDRFIACSQSVRDCLAALGRIPARQIEVIHDCTSLQRAETTRRHHTREQVRQELGLPAAAFVVVACGTFDWRKGAELFVPICAALARRLRGAEFRAIWVGDYGAELTRQQFEHEAERAGLAGKVMLAGPQPDPSRWMRAADCFALPSREDPFPMVMLEAAALGLPVVGFRGSGGVEEFVEADAGLLAPYLDLEAFAAALATLAADPAARAQLGAAARAKACELYDEEISFSRIARTIEEVATPLETAAASA